MPSVRIRKLWYYPSLHPPSTFLFLSPPSFSLSLKSLIFSSSSVFCATNPSRICSRCIIRSCIGCCLTSWSSYPRDVSALRHQWVLSKWIEELWNKERTKRTFATFRSVLRSEPSFAPVTMMARVKIAVATSLALTGMIGKAVRSSGSRMIVVGDGCPHDVIIEASLSTR